MEPIEITKRIILVVLVTVGFGSQSNQAATPQELQAGQIRRSSTVTGTVRDSASGDPLPSANVFVPGTVIGMATDRRGNFSLRNVPLSIHTLKVAYIGYVTVSTDSLVVVADSVPHLNIQLQAAPLYSSADLHRDVMNMGRASADSDLAKGIVVLYSPDDITPDEAEFARNYGFTFKKNKKYSMVYFMAYDARVNEYLVQTYGERFNDNLKALWHRNHEQWMGD